MKSARLAFLLLLVCTLKILTIAYEYRSKILNQRITHYDNPHVDLDVRYFGDEGYPFIVLQEAVTHYNDLYLMLYAKFYDGPPHLLANAPLSVCQLLHDEEIMKNLTISQYNIPQIYGFAGRSCPIEQKKIRLTPYIFPANFSTDVDIGCGYMNVESRLMKCNDGIEGDSRDCVTLLKTVTLAYIINDDCELDANDEPYKKHDWIRTGFARVKSMVNFS